MVRDRLVLGWGWPSRDEPSFPQSCEADPDRPARVDDYVSAMRATSLRLSFMLLSANGTRPEIAFLTP